MGLATYDEKVIDNAPVSLNDAQATDARLVVVGGRNGTRINSIIATSTAALPHNLEVCYNDSPPLPMTTVVIPAGAGTDGTTPTADCLAGLPAAFTGIVLDSNDNMMVRLQVALLSGETINVFVFAGDF